MAGRGGAAVEVEGAPQLRRALRRMGDGAADLTAANREAARDVEAEAEHRVPVRTGRLRSSIKSRATKRAAAVVGGGARAIYGPPIHFGWRRRNIEPNPFLYSALDARRDDVVKRYEDRIDDLVERLDREAPR